MQTAATTQPYSPVIARNIPLEMANICAERGMGMTKKELMAEGFTEAQVEKHAMEAARIIRQRSA